MMFNSVSTLGMIGDYNENSLYQMCIIKSMKNFMDLASEQLEINGSSPLIITDFGSSHGKNSIEAMKMILLSLQKKNKLLTSPIIIHNDLPTNDWSKVFQLLEKDQSYYGLTLGKSFYYQCLPSNSLSLGFSSTSLQWLSQTPCYITNHCFHRFANENESQAFANQAKIDFNSFIKHRSNELLPGGILLLNFLSIDNEGKSWVSAYVDVLYSCAQNLFNEKELSQLTIPLYFRSLDECLDEELFSCCSLKLIKSELNQMKLPLFEQHQNTPEGLEKFIQMIANVLYSAIGSSFQKVLQQNQREKEEQTRLLIQLWNLFKEKLKTNIDLLTEYNYSTSIFLLLKKLKQSEV